MSSLEDRVRRLERTNRALWIALAAGLLLAARAPFSDVVRATRFELVDDEGRVQARLAEDPEHGVGLFVLDDEGRLRLKAGHHEGSSGLFLLDDKGHVRVGAAQFAHGGGGIALHGEESRGATVLYMQDGKGSLRLFDGEGAVTAQFPSKK